MINAVSEQFNKFVNFAEEQVGNGKSKAIATKGDVLAGGGTTLEERKISLTDKTDWVSLSFLRGSAAKRVNNEVRDMFKKTVFDMFGGERNVPDSVKDAMLMKDYGHGKPLTARRIIAVRDAIANLNRVNCFDKANDPDGQLAKKAIAARYTRLDFGKLNTAANLLFEAKHGTQGELSYSEALEQVITEGTAANRTMKAGSLYMKSAEDFRKGMDYHERIADGDKRSFEMASQYAGENSVGDLSEIADHLAYKYANLLHDADQHLDAAGLPRDTLDELREAATAVKEKFEAVKNDLASGKLNGNRAEVYKQLFCADRGAVNKAAERVFKGLRDVAARNPAIEEFRKYLSAFVKKEDEVCDRLASTYKEAVAHDMTASAISKLNDAAAEGGKKNNSSGEIPKAILNSIEKFLVRAPFDRIKNIETFCTYLKEGGDVNLRFTSAQKDELRKMVEEAFGKGPKADKVLSCLVEQFEASFFAEQLLSPTDFAKNPPTGPSFIVGYFKSHPEALGVFDPGLKLGTPDEIKAAKDAIKSLMLKDLVSRLNEPDTSKPTSLSSGLFPQAVREYDPGYVTFKGNNIPNAELGTKFPQLSAGGDTPPRRGYAEFLEKTFGPGHTKMRQLVSFVCSMANGLGGAIDHMIDHGDKCIKGVPRDTLMGKYGFLMSAGLRSPDENYNIDMDDDGNVKITFTHTIQNSVSTIVDGGNVCKTPLISRNNDCTTLGSAKMVVTMTIKNAADADLAPDKMPEFTIDEIRNEE